MKVKELIEKLSKVDQDAEVLIYNDSGECAAFVENVEESFYTKDCTCDFAECSIPEDILKDNSVVVYVVGR